MMGRGEAPIVLDVRSRTHRKLDARMIPGALPVDLDALESALAQFHPGDIVVYCTEPAPTTRRR
jgi:rhodanese-related sulfurtransferase